MHKISKEISPELQDYYATNIEPQLNQLEQKRLQDVKVIKKCWRAMGISAAIAAIIFFFGNLLPAASSWGEFVLIACIAVFIIGMGWQIRLKKKLRSSLKQGFIAPVCEYFGMQYQAKGFSFPVRHFTDNGILPYLADDIHAEDFIGGTHQNVEFILCESRLTRDVKDSDDKNHTEVLFNGMLFKYSFPKPFAGETRVLARKNRRNLYKTRFKGERIVLEDPRFNSLFDVYATDQVESRYILTPGFMERIMELSEHFGEASNKISFAFTQENLLIALPSSKDRFEGGKITDSFLDNSRLVELVQELNIIREIINILNLTDQSHS